MTGADESEADKIVAWLRQKGEPCDKGTLGQGAAKRCIVESLVGFGSGGKISDRQEVQRAKDYARKIEELGKQYKPLSPGRYSFSQERQGQFDPRFVPCN